MWALTGNCGLELQNQYTNRGKSPKLSFLACSLLAVYAQFAVEIKRLLAYNCRQAGVYNVCVRPYPVAGHSPGPDVV